MHPRRSHVRAAVIADIPERGARGGATVLAITVMAPGSLSSLHGILTATADTESVDPKPALSSLYGLRHV